MYKALVCRCTKIDSETYENGIGRNRSIIASLCRVAFQNINQLYCTRGIERGLTISPACLVVTAKVVGNKVFPTNPLSVIIIFYSLALRENEC